MSERIHKMDKQTKIDSNQGPSKRGPYRQNPRGESVDPNKQLTVISTLLLNSQVRKYNEYEMEAKFGTRGIKPITKQDYDNVVKTLKSMGFISNNEMGEYSLKIQPEFLDVRTGEFKTTNDFDRFRVEINGMSYIQEYCRTNDLRLIFNKSSYNVKIMRKVDVKLDDKSDEIVKSADFDDFNFRVTYKNEESISPNGKIGTEIFENWQKSQKIFRYVNRITFTHMDYPFSIDMSIIKSSNKNERGRFIKTYNIEESNVFKNPESYEIEIEVNTTQAKYKYKDPKELKDGLQKMVKFVLSGLQKTNYPISYPEQRKVIDDYLNMLFSEEYKKRGETYVPKRIVYPSDFLGPGLVALQRKNIGPINPSLNVINITAPYTYCVTDKADGDRHLLYVNNEGKIYLINMNMNVIFTGAKTFQERCFNSILDGELILHDKLGNFVNIFAAFDIYYINNVDVRAKPFVEVPLEKLEYFEEGCRLPLLKDFIRHLQPVNVLSSNIQEKLSAKALLEQYKKSVTSKLKCPITIISKKFYPSFDSYGKDEELSKDTTSIYEACNFILRRIRDNLYEYETDGLIFQPTLLGVGSSKFLEAGPKKSIRWEYAFKWKPSEATETFPHSYNTIDFLVLTKKNADGNDVITPIFENGLNMNESTQFNQYKTLELAVGFDPKKHGNPCQDLLDDKYVSKTSEDNEDAYRPKRFYPTDPYDIEAGICNIMLEMDSNGQSQMFTEEREIFSDQTIVEFRYDISKPGLWKWIPLRVRYDKTADFKAGLNSFGNDYTTANNNWYSIHNPITEKMIATGKDIPGIEITDDVYYTSVTKDKITKGLRDFHNLYVKKKLITSVSRRGNILIDFACGKGGDFPKWIMANLSFVFGIDISKDNIENRLNGACVRYLEYKKENKDTPYCLFVEGNSSLNIRSGTNMFTDKGNSITKAVFGTNNDKTLGPAVARQIGKGQNGFDVSSIQFALHYMFENNRTFYNFMRNAAECTKLNGYFIATCYDGRTIFNILKKKKQGESVEIYQDKKKIWSITKDYDSTRFEDNDSSLGYKISVYQESIGQSIPEYLVNFDFLTNAMDKYGFSLVTREEAKQMGLPEGSGMFVELYNMMMSEIKRDPKKENDYGKGVYMETYEKDISFLNRFFVYKKVRTINAEKLTKILLDQLPEEVELEQAATMLARESVKKAEEEIKPKAKSLGKKLKLIEATEALEETEEPKKKPREKKIKTKLSKVPENIVEEKVAEKEVPKEVIQEGELQEGNLQEEVIEIQPVPKPKKTTRKARPKQLVDFDIVEETDI